MGKYNKDDINFHTFLRSVREYRNVSLEDVCKGLCSESMMHYIENGERLPDYLMRNRIMGRLGVSSSGYEDYVHHDEYERWVKCQELIEAIEHKNLNRAEALLMELKPTSDKAEKIEWQLLLDMEGRVKELREEPWADIREIYEKAVDVTIPDLDFTSMDSRMLSYEEIYLILRLLRAVTNEKRQENLLRLGEYYETIVNKIKSHFLDENSKSKVYAMAVCEWYEHIIKCEKLDEMTIQKIWRHSEEALDILRNTKRTYYLLDLLSIRKQIREQGIINYQEVDERNETEWKAAFEGIYSDYNVDPQMTFNGYIYYGAEVHCIGDVIHNRRIMYGMSQKELAEGICSERTLIRTENRQKRPQQYVVEKLFQKLGMPQDYRRGKITTNDYSLREKYNYCKSALNDSDWEMVNFLYENILGKINMDDDINKQAMFFLKTQMAYRKKEITEEKYRDTLSNLLSITIPNHINMTAGAQLSSAELSLMLNLSRLEGYEEYWQWLVLTYGKRNSNHKNQISTFELIMGEEANRLGNGGNYQMSSLLSEGIIKVALSLHRTHSVIWNTYNITWNDAKKATISNNEKNIRTLNICRSIAQYSKEKNLAQIINAKIKKIESNEDWL
ncbi:MAG: transcriptional regulator [Lachnospiraceae bacterium]|nr:transcriptional regulator [Lachnospiraceae bacterium]